MVDGVTRSERVETIATRRWSARLARVCTEVCAPSVIVTLLPLLIAWRATHAFPQALGWGLLVALTSSVLPMVVIMWGARRGYWDGRHVRDRAARMIPFAVLLGLSSLGLALLLAWSAPWLLVALDVAMLLSLVTATVITYWWKVSMHAAVAAGAMAVLMVAFSAWWWLSSVVVLVVSWSRVRLGDHTPAQVVIGSLLGMMIGGGSFALLV